MDFLSQAIRAGSTWRGEGGNVWKVLSIKVSPDGPALTQYEVVRTGILGRGPTRLEEWEHSYWWLASGFSTMTEIGDYNVIKICRLKDAVRNPRGRKNGKTFDTWLYWPKGLRVEVREWRDGRPGQIRDIKSGYIVLFDRDPEQKDPQALQGNAMLEHLEDVHDLGATLHCAAAWGVDAGDVLAFLVENGFVEMDVIRRAAQAVDGALDTDEKRDAFRKLHGLS